MGPFWNAVGTVLGKVIGPRFDLEPLVYRRKCGIRGNADACSTPCSSFSST
jgi:hypothetical protein